MKRWLLVALCLLLWNVLPAPVIDAAPAGNTGMASTRPTSPSDSLPPGATVLYPSPNERFGFGVVRNAVETYTLEPLAGGWYQNWSHRADAQHPASLMTAYVVHPNRSGLKLDAAALAAIAAQDPGAVWLVGNEPDMILQDNVTPTEYAKQYHQAYYAIKRQDPTALVAAGGIVQPSPLRLGWLGAAWDAYRQLYGHAMPVDVWNIHNYILPEQAGEWGAELPPGFTGERGQTYTLPDHGSLEIFQGQILAMRRWMAERGEREKPLIISEYGILFPEHTGYDLRKVSAFFTSTAGWMLVASDPDLGYPADENHLVQSWMWYSLDDVNYNNEGHTVAALMDPSTRQATPMGQVFADYVAPLFRPYVNLVAARATMRTLDGTPVSSQVVQAVSVQAVIRNRGNAAATSPFRVTIEDRAGHRLFNQVIPGMPARYGGDTRITLNWQKPAGYDWELIVRVDPENSVAESDETDNVAPVRMTGDLSLKALAVDGQTGTGQVVTTPSVKSLRLEAEVENLSAFGIRNTIVRFWDSSSLIHEQVIGDLAANGVRTLSFTWQNPPVGQHDLVAEVVMPPEVQEPITANNQRTRDLLVVASRQHLPLMTQDPSGGSGDTGPVCRFEPLTNGAFETGDLAGWQHTPYVGLMNSHCYQGQFCAILGRVAGMEEVLSQALTLPANSTLHLSFGWALVTLEPVPAGQDTMRVELTTPSGALLGVLQQFDNRDGQPVWYASSLDLSPYAGREVVLSLRVKNDAVNQTFFYVDDFRLQICTQR